MLIVGHETMLVKGTLNDKPRDLFNIAYVSESDVTLVSFDILQEERLFFGI